MRKKHTCLSYTKNAVTLAVYLCILFAVLFVVGALSRNMALFMGAFALVAVYVALIEIIFYRNTYTVIRITKEGIGNRHIFFKWEDINSYTLKEIGTSRFRRVLFEKKDDIICIGEVNDSDFWHQDPKKCVCFALNRKNLWVISSLCGEKNATLAEILDLVKLLKR